MKFLDTSVIILFTDYIPQVCCIDHLHEISNDLKISKNVHNEYYQETTLWIDENILKKYIDNGKISIVKKDLTNDIKKLNLRYPNLHEGELSIIALGIICKNLTKEYFCVIDDKNARKIAKNLELELTGSVGLIKLIKNEKNWSSGYLDDVIENIKESPFFVSNDILKELKND